MERFQKLGKLTGRKKLFKGITFSYAYPGSVDGESQNVSTRINYGSLLNKLFVFNVYIILQTIWKIVV